MPGSGSPRTADLNHIVELMSGQRNPCCALFVGAGCSVTGGVPLADEFIEIIKSEYPARYAAARGPRSYANCMAELHDNQRKDLIGRFVSRATVNRAHLGIAQLVKANIVDRILTTNFDPLILRACALVGEFPAVYDCAVSTQFRGVSYHPKSVFYIHGQWSGLRLQNVPRDLETQAEVIAPVMEDTQKDRVWIVVGYSGRSDPLVSAMGQSGEFQSGLYWVVYPGDVPASNVVEELLVKPNARIIEGYNADTFFEELASRLGQWPPQFVDRRDDWALGLLDGCREGNYRTDPENREPIWSRETLFGARLPGGAQTGPLAPGA